MMTKCLALAVASLALCAASCGVDATGLSKPTGGTGGSDAGAGKSGATGGSRASGGHTADASSADGMGTGGKSGSAGNTADAQVSACVDGPFRCSGNTLEACNVARTGYQKVVTCPVAGLCDGANGQCDVCASGSTKCDDSTHLSTCSPDGQTFVKTACPGDAPLCVSPASGGRCVECVSSADCAGSTNECVSASCSSASTCGYKPRPAGAVCASGAGTCDGAGQCNLCTPGTKVCNGTDLLACNVQGKYDPALTCSGATPYCDPSAPRCVACYSASQCPASTNACLTAVCSGSSCGFAPKAAGTACPGGTCSATGVCQACEPGKSVCSGNGVLTCNASAQYDPIANCTSPKPYCDTTTVSCVECTSSAQCTQPANPCLQTTCTGQACTISNRADTTSCSANGDTGTCSSGACRVCTSGAVRCRPGSASTVQTCDVNGSWVDSQSCSGGTPYCTTGACSATFAPASCQGLASTCGPNGNESCCASPLVTGGTFYRSYDAVSAGYTSQAYPATVASFRLDRFEVTVGRFRNFRAAWDAGWRPAAGSGKHVHLNGGSGLIDSSGSAPYEKGWDAAWTSSVTPTDATLSCNATYKTWTSAPGGNESHPINCVNVFEAHAFCIWDGGFLPSEAEWNYAASGGSEQRAYPWSSPATSTTIDTTYANYLSGSDGFGGTVGATSVVGSRSPKGDGKFGQADLSGNVWESTRDGYTSYVVPCTNCADTFGRTAEVFRGGSFMSQSAAPLLSSYRYFLAMTSRAADGGVRCARGP